MHVDAREELVQKISNALPQTQCTRCGYPDCLGYAQAIASGKALINQCPPGGSAGIEKLAEITGQSFVPLNPEHGTEGPHVIVWIDESWCIGCTLCIKACPVDAILGSNKRMHTVLEESCTGCELCVPVCPVDCICIEPIDVITFPQKTVGQTWSHEQASNARKRYEFRKERLRQEASDRQKKLDAQAIAKSADLETHSHLTDSGALDKKRAMIEEAVARAKSRLKHISDTNNQTV